MPRFVIASITKGELSSGTFTPPVGGRVPEGQMASSEGLLNELEIMMMKSMKSLSTGFAFTLCASVLLFKLQKSHRLHTL